MTENLNSNHEEKRKITEISGPFGLKIKFRGYDIVTIITILALSIIGYVVIDHKAVSAINQEKVVEALTKQEESMAAMIYILSLSQEQRNKLKLEMPNSLRKQLRKREREE